MSDDSIKDDEESFFLSEMGGVTPLKSDNKIKIKKKQKKAFRQSDDESCSFAIDDVFSDAEMVEDCPDVLSFSRSGLQRNVI